MKTQAPIVRGMLGTRVTPAHSAQKQERPAKLAFPGSVRRRRDGSPIEAQGAYSPLVSVASAAATSGRSTSSTKAIGALSPARKPIFRMRV
jgi:hypothetical protein